MEFTNINSDGVESRLRSSALVFGAALTGVVALRSIHASPWAYALLFVPFWLSSFLVFQGLFKT